MPKEGYRIGMPSFDDGKEDPHYKVSLMANGPDGVSIEFPDDTPGLVVPEEETATVTVTRNSMTGFCAFQPDKGRLVLTVFKDQEKTEILMTLRATELSIN